MGLPVSTLTLVGMPVLVAPVGLPVNSAVGTGVMGEALGDPGVTVGGAVVGPVVVGTPVFLAPVGLPVTSAVGTGVMGDTLGDPGVTAVGEEVVVVGLLVVEPVGGFVSLSSVLDSNDGGALSIFVPDGERLFTGDTSPEVGAEVVVVGLLVIVLLGGLVNSSLVLVSNEGGGLTAVGRLSSPLEVGLLVI